MEAGLPFRAAYLAEEECETCLLLNWRSDSSLSSSWRLQPEAWSLESQSSLADLPECLIKELRESVALASVAGLIFPPWGASLTNWSLSSLMALSTTAFLFAFLGRPVSKTIPRGARELSEQRLDKADCPSTRTWTLSPNLRRDRRMIKLSLRTGFVWLGIISESV